MSRPDKDFDPYDRKDEIEREWLELTIVYNDFYEALKKVYKSNKEETIDTLHCLMDDSDFDFISWYKALDCIEWKLRKKKTKTIEDLDDAIESCWADCWE